MFSAIRNWLCPKRTCTMCGAKQGHSHKQIEVDVGHGIPWSASMLCPIAKGNMFELVK